MQSCPHSTPHEMWMRRTMLTAVLGFCWQQHSTRKKVRRGEAREGEEGRRRRRAWSLDGCSNQIKARGLRTRHSTKIPARSMAAPPKQRRASCAKPKQKKTRANGKKYAARSTAKKVVRALFPLCSTLAVPGKCARLHRPRCARDLLSLAVQKHCSTRKQKKGFFHAFQRRQSDLLLLQAAATSFKHEGFAAIRTPRTVFARLVGELRCWERWSLHEATAADRRRIVQQAWRWQHSSVQP